MSTITVTNIKATGETASRAVSGVAAAWVNFDGGYASGSVSVRESINVSSITDYATGSFAANFSNNMNSANYALPAQGSFDLTGGTPLNYTALTIKQGSGYSSTSSCQITCAYCTNTSGYIADFEIVCLSIFGDLA